MVDVAREALSNKEGFGVNLDTDRLSLRLHMTWDSPIIPKEPGQRHTRCQSTVSLTT